MEFEVGVNGEVKERERCVRVRGCKVARDSRPGNDGLVGRWVRERGRETRED